MFLIFRGFDQAIQEFPTFINSFIAVSLKAAIIALIIGMVFGVLIGVLATTESLFFRAFSRIYVELLQNTPILILLFFIYYIIIPSLAGRALDGFWVGSVVLGFYHGAYIGEIVRSGIQAVNKGQNEAAASQGFTRVQAMRYIILPQAVRIIIPPITTQVVGIVKNTAVLQTIAIHDLMYQAHSWTAYTGFSGPSYMVAAIIYFVMCYPMTLLSRYLEKKFASGYSSTKKSKKLKKKSLA